MDCVNVGVDGRGSTVWRILMSVTREVSSSSDILSQTVHSQIFVRRMLSVSILRDRSSAFVVKMIV